MNKDKTIGVVGGLGPYAGLDLARKVFDQTLADHDQDHLSLLLVSAPGEVEDRTAFLAGKSGVNPGHAIGAAVDKLAGMGAEVIGIPCNTAHAPPIFAAVRDSMTAGNGQVNLLHMLEETALFVREHESSDARVAILSTTGIYQSGVYQETMEKHGIHVIPLERETQDTVHDVIYNPDYGIKAYANPVTPVARGKLLIVLEKLREQGVQVVTLGCTELPLAITETSLDGITIVDPTMVLARALVREAAPHKLRPLKSGS